MQPVEFARIYFVRGTAPKHWDHQWEVDDPPASGYSHAAVVRGEKRSTILCPYTLQAYQVTNKSGEIATARFEAVQPEKLGGFINRAWETFAALGIQRDYEVAAMVLTSLGLPVPKLTAPPKLDAEGNEVVERRGGKPVNEEALSPCKRTSKRGQVAEFFLSGPQSVLEAMAKLDLTRSGVLSHLFTLNKDHGVGYELLGEQARLIVPEGFDLFAYVEPERAPRAEKAPRPDGAPPRKRSDGKPVNEAALSPIPEPGKRATVARMFAQGWFPIADAMAKLELDRSAVLSHLFTINKENGLGYEFSEDRSQARLVIPKGHVAFAPKGKKK
jgi:hypothetical protein